MVKSSTREAHGRVYEAGVTGVYVSQYCHLFCHSIVTCFVTVLSLVLGCRTPSVISYACRCCLVPLLALERT